MAMLFSHGWLDLSFVKSTVREGCGIRAEFELLLKLIAVFQTYTSGAVIVRGTNDTYVTIERYYA